MGRVAQAEEVADGGEKRVGVVVVRFGDGRADGGAGVVEELVLEAHGHVSDGVAVGFVQLGATGEESRQLALADLVGVVAQLLEQEAGGLLVTKRRIASGRFLFDDHQGRIDSFLTPETVLIGLGTKVVHVIEGDLVEVADPGVEVARDGNVQNQRQAVAARALNADVLVERDDRLGGGRGADDQVGLDQGLAQAFKGDRKNRSSGRRRPGPGRGCGW